MLADYVGVSAENSGTRRNSRLDNNGHSIDPLCAA